MSQNQAKTHAGSGMLGVQSLTARGRRQSGLEVLARQGGRDGRRGGAQNRGGWGGRLTGTGTNRRIGSGRRSHGGRDRWRWGSGGALVRVNSRRGNLGGPGRDRGAIIGRLVGGRGQVGVDGRGVFRRVGLGGSVKGRSDFFILRVQFGNGLSERRVSLVVRTKRE
jgi:hypothetical protein